jgi:hypothetical protein
MNIKLTETFTAVKVLSEVTLGEDPCFAAADFEKLIEKE